MAGKAGLVQLLTLGAWALYFYLTLYVSMAVVSRAFSSVSVHRRQENTGGSCSPCSIAGRRLSDTQEHACLCLVFAVGSWTRLRSAVSDLGGRRQLGIAIGILSLWDEHSHEGNIGFFFF